MKAVGIICEYNPFHNGHIYHIEQVKKQFPNHVIVLVMSGPFTQRADVDNFWILFSSLPKTRYSTCNSFSIVIAPFANRSAPPVAKTKGSSITRST